MVSFQIHVSGKNDRTLLTFCRALLESELGDLNIIPSTKHRRRTLPTAETDSVAIL